MRFVNVDLPEPVPPATPIIRQSISLILPEQRAEHAKANTLHDHIRPSSLIVLS
jgi:hypothetical protein